MKPSYIILTETGERFDLNKANEFNPNEYDLSYEFSKDKYELWSLGDEDWISEEETIFKGQRIISVTQEENYTIMLEDIDMGDYIIGLTFFLLGE